MSEFELLAIPISLVLGLGVTQILSGVTAAIRGRDQAALHWLPFVWAFLIFLFHVEYFFVIWDINQDLDQAGGSWTWAWYGPSFFHAVLLFLGAGLILPGNRDASPNLLSDFDQHGRLALIPLAMVLIVAIPLNVYQHDAAWMDLANLLNVPLALLSAFVFSSRQRGWQGLATLMFGFIQVYGMATVWSQPGNG